MVATNFSDYLRALHLRIILLDVLSLTLRTRGTYLRDIDFITEPSERAHAVPMGGADLELARLFAEETSRRLQ